MQRWQLTRGQEFGNASVSNWNRNTNCRIYGRGRLENMWSTPCTRWYLLQMEIGLHVPRHGWTQRLSLDIGRSTMTFCKAITMLRRRELEPSHIQIVAFSCLTFTLDHVPKSHASKWPTCLALCDPLQVQGVSIYPSWNWISSTQSVRSNLDGSAVILCHHSTNWYRLVVSPMSC